MTASDLTALLPLLVVAATSIAVLFVAAFRRHHGVAAAVTLGGLVLALLTLFMAGQNMPHPIPPLFLVDRYTLFYLGLILATSGVITPLAYGYLDGREENREEFYLLQLLATLGAAVLVVSDHFAALFLGLELLSISLYAWIAYLQRQVRPVEAGIKYLILAAASAAFLLFGMALIYAEFGTMAFARLGPLLTDPASRGNLLVWMGIAMIITGVGFKLAVVPFHMWTPDVYEGAPAPVTAFIATVSKGAMMALLLRLFIQFGGTQTQALVLVFSLIAAASMIVGNLLALLQVNVKRLLAYSSIAHLGYMLVALVASDALAVEALTFYLVAYLLTTLGAFGVVTALSATPPREAETFEDYRGLIWYRPTLAVILTVALFSLAGIPLTAGFVGKFYVLVTGIAAGLWPLVVLFALNSATGLFYYLRLVVILYMPRPDDDILPAATGVTAWSRAAGVLLMALVVLLVGLGVYPLPLMALIRHTVTALL